MKLWHVKSHISANELQNELNAFSQQGYEIYKLWSYDKSYEIIAYKEIAPIPEPTAIPSTGTTRG